MIRAILIDDEPMARTLLSKMIETFCPQVELVDQCENLSSGVKSIRKQKPDLVFLDIEMPGHSGLELLDFFDEEDIDFSIVFVTAYDRYAIQAFKLSAVDYLLKPITSEELISAVELAEKSRKNIQLLKYNLTQKPKKISINTVQSTQFIGLDNILYFQANGAYTSVVLQEGKALLASKSLKHFEQLLIDAPNFIRCHKSFIVNTNHITEYVRSDGGYLKINEHEIGLSPDKTADVLRLLA